MSPEGETPARRARVALGPGGEFDLIRSFLDADGEEGEVSDAVRVGPGDDALVLEDGTVLSTDLSVEGVHFLRDWLTWREAGYRAAAAGLSDLAAMAAEPVGALLSLGLPAEAPEGTGREVVAGVREALRGLGIPLLGGDLTASPGPLVLDVVSVGRSRSPVLRDGARPGDVLWVTGRLGGAAGAVRAWRAGRTPSPGLREAFARPAPRVREALWLAREGRVGALIDLSDGLAGDAGHLSAASGVRVVLEADEVPLHPALHDALHGGEDYELLLAAGPGSLEELEGEFALRFDLPLTRVGRVEEGEGVYLAPSGGGEPRPLDEGGFDHFRRVRLPAGGAPSGRRRAG